MPRLTQSLPKYTRHKASGRAIVTIGGRTTYLDGSYDSKQSREHYNRVIGEWVAAGRQTIVLNEGPEIKVGQVMVAFLHHAKSYYRRPDGADTGELHPIKMALRPLRRLYSVTRAIDFGPLAFKTVREEMVRMGWCRTYINAQVKRIRRMFKWAVEQELVPAIVLQGLQAVAPLKAGRTEARESKPVRPVSEEIVEATKAHASPQVRAMIDLQLLTGMRPGEVCAMRPMDIQRRGDEWEYKPQSHKTAHHGHERIVPLGPRAQRSLEPFLARPVQAYLFSPAEAEQWHRAQRSVKRKTPLSCGNSPGTHCKRRPKCRPSDVYDVEAYRKAITRAVDVAYMPQELKKFGKGVERAAWKKANKDHRWHPHQLRHTAATRIRREFGAERARAVLGHRHLSVTETYAEVNTEAAREIMRQVG